MILNSALPSSVDVSIALNCEPSGCVYSVNKLYIVCILPLCLSNKDLNLSSNLLTFHFNQASSAVSFSDFCCASE